MTFSKNVRFWVYWNGDFCKLTLCPGATITLHSGGSTEEGWSSETEEYEYDNIDGVVHRRCAHEGQDCDGRYGWYANHHWRLREDAVLPVRLPRGVRLEAGDMETIEYWDDEFHRRVRLLHKGKPCYRPVWVDGHRSQYDQFAELAGY